MASQTASKNIILSSPFQNYIQTIYNNDSIETFDKIKQIQNFIREEKIMITRGEQLSEETFDKIKQIQNFIGDEKIMITLAERQLSEFQDIEDTKYIKNILNSSLSQIFTYMSKNKNNISITELDFINQNSHTITMTIKETFKNNDVQLEEKEDEDDTCVELEGWGTDSGSEIPDADLVNLSNLTQLPRVDLRLCKITDAGLVHLSNLTKLTSLNLRHSDKITDAGLVHLSNLTELTSLDLSSCRNITDAGLVHLANLTELTSLNLSHSDKITDAGLVHLSNLTKLTVFLKEL